jgi:hypothetical protein
MELMRMRPILDGKFLGADHGSWIVQESGLRRGINHFRQLNVVLETHYGSPPP